MCPSSVKIWKFLVLLSVKFAIMTNLHTKMVFFRPKVILCAIAAIAISLAGCKKDEEYGSLSLETYSMDFEWGQTKEVGYTVANIDRYETPTVPAGWSCTRQGNKYRITSPTQNATGAELTGSVKISAVGSNGSTLSRTVTVAVKIAEEINVAANSMIVSQPGKRFKFKALRRGNETSESITGAVAASRLWTTSKTALFNVSLENGYLYFATGTTDPIEEANAVVAITDSRGYVLWSWHIWLTGFDPAAEPDIIGGHRVMNRNLGAFASSGATPEDAVRSYGLYYQWGRKDPFVGPRAWNSNVPMALYNNAGSYTTHTYVTAASNIDMDSDEKGDLMAGTLEYAVARPGSFIAGDPANGFNWLGASNSGLWSATSKTVYDPCPAGWRVAPREIWAAFTTTGGVSTDPTEFSVDGEYKYGWNFIVASGADGVADKTVFLPAAGRRSFSPTLAKPEDNFTNVVNDADGAGQPVGFYWSSTPPSQGGAALAFRRDYINPGISVDTRELNATASGFPLRCVAE
jgi:hypothetical protein